MRKSKKTCNTQDQSVSKLEQVIEKLEKLKSESDEKHVRLSNKIVVVYYAEQYSFHVQQ